MNLKEKLDKPACSKWNELADKKPERFSYVLINTQYCKYPAQTALWNGFEFKSTDNSKYMNVTHWAEINDLGQKILPYHEDDKNKALRISIDQLKSSFDAIRGFKFGNRQEEIEMIFECVGNDISNLELLYTELTKDNNEKLTIKTKKP